MGAFASQSRVLPGKKVFILGIIDVQNDFLKGGSLEVKNANEVVGPINKLRFTYFDEILTFVTQDYHPSNHMSFAKTHNKPEFSDVSLDLKMPNGKMHNGIKQKLWPVHCVRDTFGSDFHEDLIVTKKDIRIQKGIYENVESYSAFGDQYKGKYEDTKLHDLLRQKNVTDIVLTGIALDYCVYFTALDSIRLGYKVHLIMSCTRGVADDTSQKAIYDMKEKGVNMYEGVNDFYDYYALER
jgi:nicotinamidase/pyrazinamidase